MDNQEKKEKNHFLRISLENPKSDNRDGAWNLIRESVTPWYQGGLTDDYLQERLKNGGYVEIEFKPTGQREKTIEALSCKPIHFKMEVNNK